VAIDASKCTWRDPQCNQQFFGDSADDANLVGGLGDIAPDNSDGGDGIFLRHHIVDVTTQSLEDCVVTSTVSGGEEF
jgi:hypothetical protein